MLNCGERPCPLGKKLRSGQRMNLYGSRPITVPRWPVGLVNVNEGNSKQPSISESASVGPATPQ